MHTHHKCHYRRFDRKSKSLRTWGPQTGIRGRGRDRETEEIAWKCLLERART